MTKNYKKGAIVLLFLAVLGSAFTGSPPGPLSYVAETCYDGLDNDTDGLYGGPVPVPRYDSGDGECIWMPHKTFGPGEYDGQGSNDPAGGFPDVDQYVVNWLNGWTSETPTHFEMVKALIIEDQGSFTCISDLQDSLNAYKNGYGLPNEMTGANEHMAECGVSY